MPNEQDLIQPKAPAANEQDLVQPKNPTPKPAVVEPTTPDAAPPAQDTKSQESGLSEEVLRIPTVAALMAGNPPAASGSIQDFSKRPEGVAISKNKDALLSAGFFFYKSLDGSTGVLGNGLYIHPEQIKQADQTGNLQAVAPNFDTVGQAVATSGDKHPVLAHGGKPPEGFATAPAADVPQTANAPAPPAGVQNKLTRARLATIAPGPPTSGPKPGAGRLINSILKNPV